MVLSIEEILHTFVGACNALQCSYQQLGKFVESTKSLWAEFVARGKMITEKLLI